MKKLQPELRFKEFSEEYSYEKLRNKVDFKGGYAFSSKNMSSNPQKYQLIKMSNVYMNKLRLDRNPSYWGEVSTKEKAYILKKGDVILTLTGTVGKRDYGYSTSIEDEDKFLLNQRLVRIRGKNELSSSKFIKYLVLNERFLYNFFANSKGGTGNQSNASVEDIKEIQLYFPSLPEQEKISSFLSSVDEKIQKLESKEEKLREYKKGIMQGIFSQEIRFKDDNNQSFPDWEEKKLGEVATFINGKAYKQKELLEKGKYPVLRVGNFFTSNNWYYSDLELDEHKYCDNGDLLYAWSASFGPRIWEGEKVIYHYHIWKVLNSEKINKNYLFSVLDYETEIIKTKASNGFGLLHITKGTIENWPTNLPCLEEQEKIAKFLSSVDEKIEKVGGDIDRMKEYKKGLLQKMFV